MALIETAILALALTGCSLLAYALRVLTWRGAAASFVLGAIIIVGGGLGWFILMVAFTGIAFAATLAGRRRKKRFGTFEAHDGERGAPNVLANGGAPAIAALLAFAAARFPTELSYHAASWAYVTAVSAIMADTLASEVGGISAKTRLITNPMEPSQPGINGAVSLLGQLSALLGPIAIAAIAVPSMGLDWNLAWIPVLGGFLASQMDSILGATVERDELNPDRWLSKGSVNFIASFLPMLAVLAALQLASI